MNQNVFAYPAHVVWSKECASEGRGSRFQSGQDLFFSKGKYSVSKT